MTLSALIFDVDGTLADTEEAHRLAFNQAFECFQTGWTWAADEYRRLLNVAGGKDRLAHYIGSLPMSPVERRLSFALIPALHAEKTRCYNALLADGEVQLRPGIARLLDEAGSAGCRLAIASTTTATNIETLLRVTLGPGGIDRFSVIACGDQVRAKKPAPDIYQVALRSLGVAPHHAVAFEDSSIGVQAAVSAGLYTVVTPTFWSIGSDLSAASLRLPDLGDPDRPLLNEPGGQLRHRAWLTIAELQRALAEHPVHSDPHDSRRAPCPPAAERI